MLASPQTSSSPFGRSSPVGAARQPKRPVAGRDGATSSTTEKQPLWTPMLQSASKGKDVSEKQLILLGGTPDLQRELLDQINPETSVRQNLRSNDRRRQRQNMPISNRFALGYTYHDVLDADQEDILARMNVYMLANPSGQFGALLRPLLTSKTVKDTLVTIILEWNDPFSWARQLRQWIRLLRKVILTLDQDTKLAMEENLNAWKEKRVGPDAQSSAQPEVVAPLGPGEWDEGLGFPISVLCVQSEKVERLERELGWGDDQFDFLQQWLRTVLLKHGGSLVYTASFEPNNVRTLIHASLNIQSLLKKEVAKHNVIDRDKILIPPNWDSWGKIRILREGFDPEAISNAWSVDIQDPPEDSFDPSPPASKNKADTEAEAAPRTPSATDASATAVTNFEQSLPNPVDNSQSYGTQTGISVDTEVTTKATPFQDFLQAQSVVLEKLKVEDSEALERVRDKLRQGVPSIDSSGNVLPSTSGAVSPSKHALSYNAGPANVLLNDSIGAYRVNVNGIDMDAEEATRRLREREHERNNALRRAGSEAVVPNMANTNNSTSGSGAVSPIRPSAGNRTDSSGFASTTPGTGTNDGKPSNEALHGFFANLIKKGEHGRNRAGGTAGGSGTGSPRRESPAPPSQRDRET